MTKLLQISGGMLIFSMFAMGFIDNRTYGYILFTSACTLFTVAVLLNCVALWKGKDVLNLVADVTFTNGINHFKNKAFVKALFNFIIYPMCIIGIGMVVIDLACMWVIALR